MVKREKTSKERQGARNRLSMRSHRFSATHFLLPNRAKKLPTACTRHPFNRVSYSLLIFERKNRSIPIRNDFSINLENFFYDGSLVRTFSDFISFLSRILLHFFIISHID